MREKIRGFTGRAKGRVSLACSLLFLAAVLVLTVRGIRNTGREYQALLQMDLSRDAQGSVGYDDGLYGSIRSGIEIDHRDSDNKSRLTDFAGASLRAVDKRILTCTVIYTMLTSALAAYWLYVKSGSDPRKHAGAILLAVVILWAILFSAVLLAHAAFGLPFYFPPAGEVPILLVSLLAVLGGSCFLGWMLRLFPFKRVLTLAAVPAVLLLFMQGTVFEGRLYCPREVPSFDYIAEEIEPRIYEEDFEGTVYYDREKDVIVLNGTEYPPRLVPNPERLTGGGRAAGCTFEILSPWSGIGLYLIREAEQIWPGAGILSLYALKALALAAFPFFIKRKAGG